MSTIKVSAIQDLSGGTNVDVPNAAKAWVRFNGQGTVAIDADYNVSSITDIGTGQYTVNFTTAFLDANYTIVSSSGYPGVTNGYTVISTQTTTTSIVASLNTAGSVYDPSVFSIVYFR